MLVIIVSKSMFVMKKLRPLLILFVIFGVTYSVPAFSQVKCDLLQANNAIADPHGTSAGYWFGIMELPFLFISVFFAFLTAYALRGGKFGKGMTFMAWGFLVMAVGHLHMQIEHYYGFNLFKSLLGQLSGSIAWFIALIVTWGLSGLGFWSIYKASKGA
jgi:hypothetical protein